MKNILKQKEPSNNLDGSKFSMLLFIGRHNYKSAVFRW